MFCPKCGTETPDDSQFCRKCGNALSGPASVPTTQKSKLWSVRPFYAAVLVLFLGLFGWLLAGGANKGTGGASGSRPLSQLHTINIGNGSAAVAALNCVYYELPVPDGANNVKVQGHFTAAGGTGNDIEVMILSEDDFTNWQNGHESKAFYQSGKTTVGDISAILPNSAGTYYLVLNNKFSLLTSKAVQFNAAMTYYQ